MQSLSKSEELAEILSSRMKNREGGSNLRLALLLGMITKDNQIKANIPSANLSKYSQVKWQFFLDAPFEIGNQCCRVMKKNPSHKYTKETGRKPITAQMASESRLRTQKWLQYGCNSFDAKKPISNPMSFWFDQDVLLYIKKYNIPICSIYGDIVKDDGTDFDLTEYEDKGIFELDRPSLKTTGCSRTGCMFCGFGCHLEKPGEGRFERMKETHPKQYEYLMKSKEEGGLGYKEIIDWINEHGNLNIQY